MKQITNFSVYYIVTLLFKEEGITFNEINNFLINNNLDEYIYIWEAGIRRSSIPETKNKNSIMRFRYDNKNKKYYPLESHLNDNYEKIKSDFLYLTSKKSKTFSKLSYIFNKKNNIIVNNNDKNNKIDVIEYIKNRLQRKDIGNNKGYRGHTLVIQETFFKDHENIKKFVNSVNEVGYVDLTNIKKVNNKLSGSESYEKVCKDVSSNVNYTLLKKFSSNGT